MATKTEIKCVLLVLLGDPSDKKDVMVARSYAEEKVRAAFSMDEPFRLLDSENKEIYDRLIERER